MRDLETIALALTAAETGMRTVTVVPDPGLPVICTSPESRAARSRMPISPIDLALPASSGEMPRPLSTIVSTRLCSAMMSCLRGPANSPPEASSIRHRRPIEFAT